MNAAHQYGIYFLLYHKVSGELPLEIDLPFDLFRRQMELLRRTCQVIHYDEGLGLLCRKTHLTQDLFVLTFDDGYDDFWSHAFPLLQDLQMPATAFITTAFVEDGPPCVLSAPPTRPVKALTWDKLAALQQSGMITLGAHTHTHVELPQIGPARIAEELTRPQDLIRERLGVSARHFAYPRARWSEGAEVLVKDVYDTAALAGWDKAVADSFNQYRIPRVPILKRDGWDGFLAKIGRGAHEAASIGPPAS